jgi:hypothetical protein
MLLGMAIKYAGLCGKKVHVIGRNRSSIGEEDKIQCTRFALSAAFELSKPYDARLMRCYPVSTRINSVANDDEACSAPVELAQIQNRLFF